jgi:hypothetical protein
MKKFNSVFLIVLLASFGLVYFLGRSHGSNGKAELKEEVARKSLVVDSLRDEIMVKDIELGRYEYVIDQLREKDSAKVDYIMGNTE